IALTILLGQTFATNILPITALALLFALLHKEFGWTKQQFAFASTSLMFAGAFSALAMGYLVDKTMTRPLILAATIALGFVTMAISQTHSLAMFCGLFALLGLFGSVSVAYGKILTALFHRHRGKALAIFGAETAIAAAIAPQLINHLITNYGWRQS